MENYALFTESLEKLPRNIQDKRIGLAVEEIQSTSIFMPDCCCRIMK